MTFVLKRFYSRHLSPEPVHFIHLVDTWRVKFEGTAMAISPYIARLRERVGHELLVLPSVAVLPRDDNGRILLVQIADTGQWATIGGAIEPDEPPETAALREAEEEAGVVLTLGALLGVVGGPEYRMVYPNGDETSYVTTVYDAQVISGTPRPDHDETTAVRWWAPDALPVEHMSTFTIALFKAIGFRPR
jgi:8-oxo-dGTP pyrophosphatase MutT (NUDIX family)